MSFDSFRLIHKIISGPSFVPIAPEGVLPPDGTTTTPTTTTTTTTRKTTSITNTTTDTTTTTTIKTTTTPETVTPERVKAQVQDITEPALYGPIQFDCDCQQGKRIDFRECQTSGCPSDEKTKLADDDTSSDYQNGLPCTCAYWTPWFTSGQCVDKIKFYRRTCVKDDVEFFDSSKNNCFGESELVEKCDDSNFWNVTTTTPTTTTISTTTKPLRTKPTTSTSSVTPPLFGVCVFDDPDNRILTEYFESSADMDVTKCINICQQRGFKFSGLEWSRECHCGNLPPGGFKYSWPDKCNLRCAGKRSQVCGGYDAMNVWTTPTEEFVACVYDFPGERRVLNNYSVTGDIGMTISGCEHTCAFKGSGFLH